ncbi:MAG: hypothetical protein KKC55_14940 [Gammaproteobacteria bacterium]|nr:hypothetical protein [Gammaproteobacteria bacterium]
MASTKIYTATDFDILTAENDIYATAHDAANATSIHADGDFWWYYRISNSTPGWDFDYEIARGFLTFDTSNIKTRIITAASLFLYHVSGGTETDAGQSTLYVVEGVQTIPLASADYGAHLTKTVSGGSVTEATIAAAFNDWLEIPLNAEAWAWINKTGITKFCLRVAGDIDNNVPTGKNRNAFASTDGNGLPADPDLFPYLSVTSIPASSPRRDTSTEDQIALKCVRNVEMAAGGRFYVDEEGKAVYKSRYARNA